MSINSQMKRVKLQCRIKVEDNRFGASTNYKWADIGIIEVAIYQDERSVIINNTKYVETYCTGITRATLSADSHRLINGDTIYSIQSVIPGRLNKLTLKVVDPNE